MFVSNDFCGLKQDGGQAQHSRTFECFCGCVCVFSANYCGMLFEKANMFISALPVVV